MTAAPRQAAPSHPGTLAPSHLVLFDGVCGLCNGLVQFLLKRDTRRVFRFAPLQSVVGQEIVTSIGGDASLPASFHVVAGFEHPGLHTPVFTKSRAVLFVARELGWPWRAAGVLRIVPRGILDWLYDRLAQSRYRLFGRYEQCLIPAPEFQDRFIDADAVRRTL